jgi:hypothetical protein
VLLAPTQGSVLSVQGFDVVKPTSGTSQADFTVTLSPPNIENVVTVDYTVTPITAVPGVDYLNPTTPNPLTFPFGATTETVPVTILGNTNDGGPHTLSLSLSNATNATIDPNQGSALGIIEDNAAAGTLQFSAPDFPTTTLAGSVTVTVTRLGGQASGVSVHFATGGGTAVPGVDYTPTSGTLNFGFGVTSQTFTIPILPNFLNLQPRTIGLTLSNPGGGGTLGQQSTATVTIQPVNPLIVTNTADSGLGSLREAILAANAIPGPNEITFDIPGTGPFTIVPASPLPAAPGPVDIDARTQPGYSGSPLVAVDGSQAGSLADGLVFQAGSSAVYGLAIDHFGGSGVVLDSDGNIVQADRIGTDVGGQNALGNGLDGVYVFDGSGNRIGGTTAAEANVISGNGNVGVEITGPDASGNMVLGNLIGTDLTGTHALGNAHGGVFINGAPNNHVGGPDGGRNLISGNGGAGVEIVGASATGNVVQNNLIGTDITGDPPLGNAADGVFIDDAPGNLIGGLGPSTGNVISGNGLTGLRFMGAGASGNQVFGSLIGTDATGTRAVGNTFDGVFINGSPDNTIGSGTVAGRNVISGNGGSGLQILGATASGNQVFGNLIGTDITGTRPLGNLLDGVFVNQAPDNAIGGLTPGQGNVISANVQVGLQLFGAGATGNVVFSNLIGTNILGTPDLGNTFGIFVNQAPGNTIPGPGMPGANTIAGNTVSDVLRDQGQGGPILLSTAAQSDGTAITSVLLTLSTPMDPQRAQDLSNYSLRTQSPSGQVGPRVALTSATYDPSTLTVTLGLASPVPVAGTYRVTIKAGPQLGLTSQTGQFLDGDYNGRPGGTSISFIRDGHASLAPGTARPHRSKHQNG